MPRKESTQCKCPSAVVTGQPVQVHHARENLGNVNRPFYSRGLSILAFKGGAEVDLVLIQTSCFIYGNFA